MIFCLIWMQILQWNIWYNSFQKIVLYYFFVFTLIKFFISTPVDTLNLALGCLPSYVLGFNGILVLGWCGSIKRSRKRSRNSGKWINEWIELLQPGEECSGGVKNWYWYWYERNKTSPMEKPVWWMLLCCSNWGMLMEKPYLFRSLCQ